MVAPRTKECTASSTYPTKSTSLHCKSDLNISMKCPELPKKSMYRCFSDEKEFRGDQKISLRRSLQQSKVKKLLIYDFAYMPTCS
jgi:hypothetical protein